MTARTQMPTRACESCGKRFGRKTSPAGRLEDASQFAKRRFCSRACYRTAVAEGRHVRFVGEWIIQPRALTGTRSAVSDTVSGARATPANRVSQNGAAADSAQSEPSEADVLTRIPQPRHEETP